MRLSDRAAPARLAMAAFRGGRHERPIVAGGLLETASWQDHGHDLTDDACPVRGVEAPYPEYRAPLAVQAAWVRIVAHMVKADVVGPWGP